MRKTWTKEKIIEEALKYNNHTDFFNSAAQAVRSARKHGYYDEITKHFIKRITKHTKDECLMSARLCKTREEFKKKYRNQHASALHNGWYEECTEHMPKNVQYIFRNSKENCRKAAKKCTTMSQFIKASPGAYKQAKSGGFLKEITAHFEVKGNKKKRLIYLVHFSDNSIYFGLTMDFERRKQKHLGSIDNRKHSSVYRYFLKTGLKPNFHIISNLMSDYDAKILEEKLIRYFKLLPFFNVINENSGGGLGGSINYKDYTFDEMGKIIKDENIKNQRELRKRRRDLFTVAKNKGFLNDLIPKKTYKINSVQQCLIEALKYKTKYEFYKGSKFAYRWAKKNDCFDLVTKHMKQPNLKWDKKTVLEIAKKSSSYSDFYKKYQRAYFIAKRDGFIDDIARLFK